MGQQVPPSILCQNCKHLFDKLIEIKFGKDIESDWLSACKAFPKGIPDDIMEDIFKHTKLYPGQKNDVIFKKK